MVVDSDVPIVAERSMYWPGRRDDWTEAHNSAGATETGTVWAVAGGEEGGAYQAQTYVLIANTSAFAGTARVTVLRENGAPLTREVTLDANSRTNVPIGEPRIRRGAPQPLRRARREPRRPHARADRRRARDLHQRRRGAVWAAGSASLATRIR